MLQITGFISSAAVRRTKIFSQILKVLPQRKHLKIVVYIHYSIETLSSVRDTTINMSHYILNQVSTWFCNIPDHVLLSFVKKT